VRALADLWAGRLPLGTAFWIWGVFVGLTVNFAATAATMAVLAAGLPGSAAVAVHLVPLPYNIITAVGIWRSAGNHDGARFWADMARVAAVALAVGLTLI